VHICTVNLRSRELQQGHGYRPIRRLSHHSNTIRWTPPTHVRAFTSMLLLETLLRTRPRRVGSRRWRRRSETYIAGSLTKRERAEKPPRANTHDHSCQPRAQGPLCRPVVWPVVQAGQNIRPLTLINQTPLTRSCRATIQTISSRLVVDHPEGL
jgi:hypothetical protein